jgi:zinc and cadmium transporter
MIASLSGAVFASRFLGGWLAPRLRYLVALAAGVFIVIIYNLTEEVLHEGITPWAAGAFVLGAVLLDLVTRLLPKNTHHHHGPHPEHPHAPIDARRMLAGDAVHNIHDGLTLVPAFLVSPAVGLGTAAGVLLHEIVQEIAEFFVLREAGYSVRKALTWNFAVSGTILVGAGLALTLTSVETLALPLVAFSAGGFTYIVLRDLLPSVISHAKAEQKYLQYAAAFAAGLCIMLAVSFVAPHGHEEEEEFHVPEGFGIAMR